MKTFIIALSLTLASTLAAFSADGEKWLREGIEEPDKALTLSQRIELSNLIGIFREYPNSKPVPLRPANLEEK